MPSLHHTKLNSLYLYFLKKNRSHEQCDLVDHIHQIIFDLFLKKKKRRGVQSKDRIIRILLCF